MAAVNASLVGAKAVRVKASLESGSVTGAPAKPAAVSRVLKMSVSTTVWSKETWACTSAGAAARVVRVVRRNFMLVMYVLTMMDDGSNYVCDQHRRREDHRRRSFFSPHARLMGCVALSQSLLRCLFFRTIDVLYQRHPERHNDSSIPCFSLDPRTQTKKHIIFKFFPRLTHHNPGLSTK